MFTGLGNQKPIMPLFALASDNWIGRERMIIRNASQATRWLSCLGRFCWKQVRLGVGAPDITQKGVAGNTIFFAQPTAKIPELELPPSQEAVLEDLNVLFAKNTYDLSTAQWSQVNRAE